MTTLQEIRAKLIEQQNKADNKNTGGGDRALFPFWNAEEGQSSTIRFLPDADPNNVYFWVERLVIKLPFQGVKNEHDREVTVQVPCMEMYGKTCPILAETRPWWRDDSLVDLARKYWKKRSYLFNGFVLQSAFEEKDLPENPIRRFSINTSIFDIIKASLMNPEMEDLPTDYNSGRDFKLVKTKKGDYANYSTSNWSFKTRSLSDYEQDAIAKYGLFNLRDFLPKEPTPAEVEIIKEMFQASVNDEAYDLARWGDHFKPFGTGNGNGDSNGNSTVRQPVSSPATSTVSQKVVEKDDVPSALSFDEEMENVGTASVASSAAEALSRLRGGSSGNSNGDVKPTPVATPPKRDPMDILQLIKAKQAASAQ